mmetsp:Transcript_18319/g.31893  ORF Transcript_18319/g.31893 Transcript_18319/m.31893 type:complete len:126 (-) Transcript_18319:66-443(-)
MKNATQTFESKQKRRRALQSFQRKLTLTTSVADAIIDSWVMTAARPLRRSRDKSNWMIQRLANGVVFVVLTGCFPVVAALAVTTAVLNFALLRSYFFVRRLKNGFVGLFTKRTRAAPTFILQPLK